MNYFTCCHPVNHVIDLSRYDAPPAVKEVICVACFYKCRIPAMITVLVDAIGNTQRIHPTLPEPAELVNWGELFDVVIQHKINGSFTILLEGMEYILKPTFDIETRTLAEDEEVTPGVGTDSNGKLAFVTTQDEKTVVTIRLMLIDPQGNELDL